jgi:hypothetical protein
MKKPAIVLALAVMLCGELRQAGAETLKSKPPHPALEAVKKKKGERNLKRLEQLTADLNLSLEQQNALAEILAKDDEAKYAVIKDAADRMDELSAQTEARIVAVLDEEQKAKYTGITASVSKEDEDGLLKVFR